MPENQIVNITNLESEVIGRYLTDLKTYYYAIIIIWMSYCLEAAIFQASLDICSYRKLHAITKSHKKPHKATLFHQVIN